MCPQLLLLALQYLTQVTLAHLDQYFGSESTSDAMHFPPEPNGCSISLLLRAFTSFDIQITEIERCLPTIRDNRKNAC